MFCCSLTDREENYVVQFHSTAAGYKLSRELPAAETSCFTVVQDQCGHCR